MSEHSGRRARHDAGDRLAVVVLLVWRGCGRRRGGVNYRQFRARKAIHEQPVAQVPRQIDRVFSRQLDMLVLLPVERDELIAHFWGVLTIVINAELADYRFLDHGLAHFFLKQGCFVQRHVLAARLRCHFQLLHAQASHALVLLLPAEIVQTFAVQQHEFQELLIVLRVHLVAQMVQIRTEEVVAVRAAVDLHIIFNFLGTASTSTTSSSIIFRRWGGLYTRRIRGFLLRGGGGVGRAYLWNQLSVVNHLVAS